ncbi:MAG TPA: DUF924 family protein [Coleofasciculaceae cyanobacterium]
MQAVLDFWLGVPQAEDTTYPKRRKLWFSKNPQVDQEIRDRFLSLYEQAATGKLAHWQQSPQGCLALLILLDQFSRHLFRGEARSFATDRQAVNIAKGAIAQGFDQQLQPVQRIFIYLPLEHSENLLDQQRSVELFRQLSEAAPELQDTYDFALRHQAVIQRFGRFPHRNSILGRTSTPAELEFLQQPGSSF